MAHNMIRLGVVSVAVAMMTASQASAEMKVGALMSLTGALATYGQPIANGALLAADEINQAGGVLGGDLNVVVADTQTNPQAGVDAAQKLVSIEGVNGIVGALASGVTIPVATTVSKSNKVPQISPASTSPVITDLDDGGYLFRTIASDAFQGVALAEVGKEKGFKSVSIIYVNNDYGKGLADSFAAAFAKQGGEVKQSVGYEEKQASYRGELQNAARGGAEALVLIAYPGDGIPIMRQSLEGGFFGKFLLSDGMKALEVVEAIGAENLEGMGGTASEADPSNMAAENFKKAYQGKFGEVPPLPYIDSSYDAVYLLALAAEKAGSNDGEKIQAALQSVSAAPGVKVGPGEWKKALELIKAGQDIDYDGASGPVDFDANGDVPGTFGHWEFVNGEIKTIKVFTPKM